MLISTLEEKEQQFRLVWGDEDIWSYYRIYGQVDHIEYSFNVDDDLKKIIGIDAYRLLRFIIMSCKINIIKDESLARQSLLFKSLFKIKCFNGCLVVIDKKKKVKFYMLRF